MGADPAKRRVRGACAAVTTLPVCGWADWRVSAGGATGAQPGNDATATQAAASDAANVAVADRRTGAVVCAVQQPDPAGGVLDANGKSVTTQRCRSPSQRSTRRADRLANSTSTGRSIEVVCVGRVVNFRVPPSAECPHIRRESTGPVEAFVRARAIGGARCLARAPFRSVFSFAMPKCKLGDDICKGIAPAASLPRSARPPAPAVGGP